MRNPLRFGVLVGVLILAMGHSLATAQPGPGASMDRPPQARSVHASDHWGARAIVNDLAFSPDGSRLAVSYYRPAMNRPGTDWAVWTAMFDLTTGKRVILADTTGPLAFSPDGQWVALTQVEREQRSRQAGDGYLALHRFGDEGPARLLQADAPFEQRPVALAFGPAGDYLKVLHGDGWLRHWPVNLTEAAEDDEPLPEPTALIRLSAGQGKVEIRPASAFWPYLGQMTRSPQGQWTVFLGSTQRQAVAGRDNRTGPAAMSWHYVQENRHVYRVSTLVDVPGAESSQTFTSNWMSLLRHVREPVALVLRSSDVDGVLFRQPTLTAYSGRLTVAYAPRATMAAVSTAAGVQLHMPAIARSTPLPERTFLPGSSGGALAFSPDESLLAVADRNAVIRLWDVQRGRIVRSLRLDDQPAETFRVAAVQAPSTFGDPQANRDALARAVQHAANLGAWVVVLPEAAVTGYLSADLKQTWQVNNLPTSEGLTGRDPGDAAETVPGPSTRFFAQLARNEGVYLTVPLVEVDPRTGRYYNSVVLLGPEGEMLIHYRKRDLWQWAERSWATRGDLGNPVVDTPLGRLGVLICFDIHEQAQVLGKMKIDTLLYSIAWVEEADSDWFEDRLPAIAQAHGFHIVAANWTLERDAQPPTWHGHGQSRIIHADGQILAARDRQVRSDVVIAELPLPDYEDGK